MTQNILDPRQNTSSQADRAYDELEERIVTLALRPGEVVSENMLASLLGMGRSPVRDAIKQLAREGLVVILPKRGVMIAEVDVRRQLELLEARRQVERFVAAAAAARATPRERETFATLAAAMEDAGNRDDGVSFLKLDKDFHEQMLATARNRYAAAMLGLVQSQARRFFYAFYQQTTTVPETARLHAQVARAISQGDSAAAQSAFDQLMDNVDAFTRATLDLS